MAGPDRDRSTADVCPSKVVLLDDRLGAITDRCELPVGHEGEHSIAYTATMPLAHLRWSDG